MLSLSFDPGFSMQFHAVGLVPTTLLDAIAANIGRTIRPLVSLLFSIPIVWSVTACAGTVQNFHYWSAGLGMDQSADVYVPSGEAPRGGWPVLYLLHGLGGSSSDWQLLGGVRETLDRLIAQREIMPLVVVMPSGGNSWYVDSADVNGPGNYATDIGHDLPLAIEGAFQVGRDRTHRAIAGVSMGGFGALRLALSEPERYDSVAALSPAIWQNMPLETLGRLSRVPGSGSRHPYFERRDAATVTIGIDPPPSGDHFSGAFGTPFDPRRFNADNVFTVLHRAIDAGKALPSIYITVGDDDSHLLWRGAIAFFETMQMSRRPIEFSVSDGDHDWTLWRRAIVNALLFIDNRFRDTPRT